VSGHGTPAGPPPPGISAVGAQFAALFDDLGLDYEYAFHGRKQAQIDAVAELIRRLPPRARVLDVGCATGRPTSEQLCAAGMRVTGVDVSEVMLELAARQVPGADFRKADLFGDISGLGTYDAVVCLFCLVNLPEETFADGMERLASLTAPGGTVLVAAPERATGEPVRFIGGRSYAAHRCSGADVARWARQAGLEVDALEVHPDPGPRGQEPGRAVFLRATVPRVA
jgi:2-polyprenyl-3-methyl-5-hydroxy-6-metoxy-1,4-benzoquinol methylase